MNFLAHVYLSFNDPELLTGNIISDFVKGKKKFDFPPGIIKGIELHRAIDQFTDDHPVNKKAAKIFKADYGLYGAAFLDIVYDHFLALELAASGQQDFEKFTERSYDQIARFESILPEAFRNLFPYMREHNWLYNYQFGFGIRNSFEGLAHRAKYLSESNTAFKLFRDNYDTFKTAYEQFFPELRTFSLAKISDIH